MTMNIGNREAITRPKFNAVTVTVTTSSATTPALDMSGYSAWAVRSPNADITSVSVFASTSESGTYTAVQIDTTDEVVTLSSSKWGNPRAGVFPFRFVKLVGNAGGVLEIVGGG